MNEFVIILGMAIATYSIRYPPLAAVSKVSLPDSITNALQFVPIAVLSAIIFPAVIFPTGSEPQVSLGNPYLIGSLASILIAWRIKKLIWTIVLGMAVFLAWRWVIAPGLLP